MCLCEEHERKRKIKLTVVLAKKSTRVVAFKNSTGAVIDQHPSLACACAWVVPWAVEWINSLTRKVFREMKRTT